jgi:hypothetical protein
MTLYLKLKVQIVDNQPITDGHQLLSNILRVNKAH